MADYEPVRPTRTYCPARPTHFHQMKKRRLVLVDGQWVSNPLLTEKWQYQLVCICGWRGSALQSKQVHGSPEDKPLAELIEDAEEPQEQPAESAVSAGSEISLDEPADVDVLLNTLFESNLDWVEVVHKLRPELSASERRRKADEWREDPRVKDGLDLKVKSITRANELSRAWLLTLARKLATESRVAAVQATALNILKADAITEKTQRDDNISLRVSNLGSIAEGITGRAPDADMKDLPTTKAVN